LNHEIFVTMNQKRAIAALGGLFPGNQAPMLRCLSPED